MVFRLRNGYKFANAVMEYRPKAYWRYRWHRLYSLCTVNNCCRQLKPPTQAKRCIQLF